MRFWVATQLICTTKRCTQRLVMLLESLYSEFPIRSFAQNMAPQDIHVSGIYVDAIPPFPSARPIPQLVPHQYQEADITYALAKDTSGQTTGVFSFANSTPVTVNMDTGQIYYSTPLSVVAIVATGAAELGAVGAGLVDIGTLHTEFRGRNRCCR